MKKFLSFLCISLLTFELLSKISAGNINNRAYNIVFVGDAGVGKTCILNRIVNNNYTRISSTIGSDFFTKSVINGYNTEFKLNFWDTAGQEIYQSLASNYLRCADIAIIMYSLNDEDDKAQKSIYKWLNCVDNRNLECKKILVGNKLDLVKNDEFFLDKIEDLKRKYKFDIAICTSAKTGEGVDILLKCIMYGIESIYENRSLKINKSVNIDEEIINKKYEKKCC